MSRPKFVLEDRPIHYVCSHGALVEVRLPYPRPRPNVFDVWLLSVVVGVALALVGRL